MLIGLGILALLVLFIGTKSFKIVGQAEVLVIERLGKFNRLARSGFNVLIPFIERPRPIDVRYFEADVNGVKKITPAPPLGSTCASKCSISRASR
jgi:regulator of protease activity HflC (stomatin/prohibitin superfamily)